MPSTKRVVEKPGRKQIPPIRHCVQCGSEYRSNYPIQKYCSKKCAEAKWNSLRKPSHQTNSNTAGAAVELIVAARLMLEGWHVFRALSPSCFCDIIAVIEGISRYIEVRTGWRNSDGSIKCPHPKHGIGATEYAVYLHSDDKIYFFAINDS